MKIKRFFTTYTLHFGFILFILGLILTILGVLGVFVVNDDWPGSVTNVIDSIGNWIYWCMLLGPFVLIAGAWYFFDNISKRREFKELMETTSKAKFIKNLDHIEFLAWKLTLEHQKELMEKKKEFNIK
jgi:hypothetical protein